MSTSSRACRSSLLTGSSALFHDSVTARWSSSDSRSTMGFGPIGLQPTADRTPAARRAVSAWVRMTASGREMWVVTPSDPGIRCLFPRLLLDVHGDEGVTPLDADRVAIAQGENVTARFGVAGQRECEWLVH